MKYNEKYDRWVTKGGLVYRYDKKRDRLVQCKLTKNRKGYLTVGVKRTKKIMRVHRLVYETFVGEIPNGYEIDHINTVRDDNRLENLRCVTHFENNNNPLTSKHRSESHKGKQYSKGTIRSDFGRKFKEHFGYGFSENKQQYRTERSWYMRHNKVCRWEK